VRRISSSLPQVLSWFGMGKDCQRLWWHDRSQDIEVQSLGWWVVWVESEGSWTCDWGVLKVTEGATWIFTLVLSIVWAKQLF
jgi:hypothetical protein